MPFTLTQLVAAQLLSNAVATYFTCPTAQAARIDSISFTNTDAGALTVTTYLVPSGGSAGIGNIVTSAQSIGAGKTFVSPNEVGQVLNPGDTIQMFASSASKVRVMVSGTVQS